MQYLVAILFVFGIAASKAAASQAHQPSVKFDRRCPSADNVNALLSTAGTALEEARFDAAVEKLQTVANTDCNARVNLLLAAALEGRGNLLAAKQTLQHAHSVWPDNTSLATSLAREHLSSGEVKEAAAALTSFRATSKTSWKEIQFCVMVFLASH
jgi:predicted Zn-dependent protease